MRRNCRSPQRDRYCQPTPTHIWQRRFYDFNVWSDHKRVEEATYMHRNPVTRGLVSASERWPWISYRAYAIGEIGPVRINHWQVLEMKI